MKKYVLSVEPRTVTGRKVKQLRKNNQLPGNIFGKQIKSQAVELSTKEFHDVYREAGETSLVELQMHNEKRPVLIHNVQLQPVTGQLLHVDFHQVDLKEKVKANVPVEIAGTAAAVEQKLGVLLQVLDEVEVETLPMDLPDKVTIDVTRLAKVGDSIKVGDITLPQNVTVVTPAEIELVKIGELVTKEAEALAQQEAAQAQAAATPEAAVETSVPETATPAAVKPPTPESKAEK